MCHSRKVHLLVDEDDGGNTYEVDQDVFRMENVESTNSKRKSEFQVDVQLYN